MSATFMGGKVRLFNADSRFKQRLVKRPPVVPDFNEEEYMEDNADNVYEIDPPRTIKLGMMIDEYTGEVLDQPFYLPLPSHDREPTICIIGASGSGKCLGKGTLVLMFDNSLRKVEDLKVGDLLMGIDGKPREILSTTNGIDKMYKISQSNGIDYIVNEPHILSLLHDDKNSDDYFGLTFTVEEVVKNPDILDFFRGWRIKDIKNGLSTENVELSHLTIDYIGEDEYYGFTLSGDRLFMLEDKTVTHNTVTVSRLIDEMRREQGRSLLILDAKNQYTEMFKPNQDENHIKILEAAGETPEGAKNVRVFIPKNMIRKFGDKICKDMFCYTDTWTIRTNETDATSLLMLGQKSLTDRDYIVTLAGIVDRLREAEREEGIEFTIDELNNALIAEIERVPQKKRSVEPLISMVDNICGAGYVSDDGNSILELLTKPYTNVRNTKDGTVIRTRKSGDATIFNTCGSPQDVQTKALITNIINALCNKLIFEFDKKTGLPIYRPILVVEEASVFYGKETDPTMRESFNNLIHVIARSVHCTKILIYQFRKQAPSGFFESDQINILIEMMSSCYLKDEYTGEWGDAKNNPTRQISMKGLAKVTITNMDFMPNMTFLCQVLPSKCHVRS